jgi:DNA gyrase subunit A
MTEQNRKIMADEEDKIEETNDQDSDQSVEEETEELTPEDQDQAVVIPAEDATEVCDPVNPETVVTEELTIVDPNIGTIKPRQIVTEMQESYLDYAMSIIVSRALPDVRDGLKPVHRRVLYSMHTLGLRSNVKYRKSATIVGEVMGNYHPHGDMAIYDTLVRMAQDFSMRYMLVDGQGNFGSMDGDSAAAMRYTEARMTKISEEMLADIDKDTVDWQDNYDGSKKEPSLLPSRIPQLLLNGSMGIAVGMATNIPPHNLTEVCDAVIHQIDNPEADVDELMEYIKGPDFPTAGFIYDIEQIRQAYATGKGKIVIRAKAEIEEQKRGFRIIVSEIPYQVNKSTLISKIAELVQDKKLDGIYDLRDESDRNGVRIVIEIRANAYPNKILNRLYELTQLQTAFHVNMLALTPAREPQLMNLKTIIGFFIEHRQVIVIRRAEYELQKAKDRAHILEGLKIALDHIEEVIETIKKSPNKEIAHQNLMARFGLSDRQTTAILEMRLSALAGLERQRVEDEYQEKLKLIASLEDLLAHPAKILALVKTETEEIKEKYGDVRRTKVVPGAIGKFTAEDLIPDEQVIVTLTAGGYIKRLPADTYRQQVRGGKGVTGMTTKDEDAVEHLINVSTHDDVMFFTNQGRLFRTKVYEIPASGRQAKGIALVNIIQLAPNEKVTAVLTENNKSMDGDKFFFMATSKGVVKKTLISAYNNVRKTGIIAIKLNKDDELRWVKITGGNDVIVQVSSKGQAICYPETDVRPMGRSAAGVRGINLRPADNVMGVDIVEASKSPFSEKALKNGFPDMLVVLENGFGKRTMLKHFHLQRRGGVGIKAANCTTKTGNLVGMDIIYDDLGDVILVSRNGQVIRMKLSTIKRLGRDTQGVTLMRMANDRVSSVTIIRPEEKNDPELPLTNKPDGGDKPDGEGESPKSKAMPAGRQVPSSKKDKNSKADDSTSEPETEKEPAKLVTKPAKTKASAKEALVAPASIPEAEAAKPAVKINAYKNPPIAKTFTDKSAEPATPEEPANEPEAPVFKVNVYSPKVKAVDEPAEQKTEPEIPRKLSDEPNYWGKQSK